MIRGRPLSPVVDPADDATLLFSDDTRVRLGAVQLRGEILGAAADNDPRQAEFCRKELLKELRAAPGLPAEGACALADIRATKLAAVARDARRRWLGADGRVLLLCGSELEMNLLLALLWRFMRAEQRPQTPKLIVLPPTGAVQIIRREDCAFRPGTAATAGPFCCLALLDSPNGQVLNNMAHLDAVILPSVPRRWIHYLRAANLGQRACAHNARLVVYCAAAETGIADAPTVDARRLQQLLANRRRYEQQAASALRRAYTAVSAAKEVFYRPGLRRSVGHGKLGTVR